jgi:hypothetical protein
MRRASWVEESFGREPGWGHPCTATANPSLAKRWRTRATVRGLTPHRSATWTSERTRRRTAVSASNRMRAWRAVKAVAVPRASKALAAARWSGVRWT